MILSIVRVAAIIPPSRAPRYLVVAEEAQRRCGSHAVLAVGAVFDDKADGLLDADPVVFLGDCGGGLVNACMLGCVDAACYLVLALRIRDDLFIFEHQSLPTFGAVFSWEQLVVSGCGTKS